MSAEEVTKLREQYPDLMELTATVNGKEETAYLRQPDYQVRKKVTLALMKDINDVISPGEIVLAACQVGGYDFFNDEQSRLGAAIKVMELIDFDYTFSLKKAVEERLPTYGPGDKVDIRHMLAMLRHHYRCDPMDWVTEGADGQPDWTELARYWAAYEFVEGALRQSSLPKL